MTVAVQTEIVTSRSAYVAYLRCPRLRWWQYEAPNGTGTRGWERRSLAIPPSTGIWCHVVAQGLLAIASGFDLRGWLRLMGGQGQPIPTNASEVILRAREGYLTEVAERGLELGAEGDTSQSWVAQEQAALLEAFGLAFARVRVPVLLQDYDIVSLEQEERAVLAGDVTLAARCDAVLRRREDGKLFVWNLKTGGRVKESNWQAQWQYDTQLLTEPLAVERRLGEKVWGVLIEGFDTGARVDCYQDTLKEVRDGTKREDAPIVRCQRSRLIYGYRTDANPPLQKALYDWEGTTRKGWYKFTVWQNPEWQEPVKHWIEWLPPEVLARQFVTLDPILRDERAVEAKVRQIVSTERDIRHHRNHLSDWPGYVDQDRFDIHFPQHDGRECLSCPMKDMCWTSSVSNDPSGSGLYQPRQDHHESEEG